MAASTIANKVVAERQIEGYIAASLPEELSLLRTGLVGMDIAPGFTTDWQRGGNTYQIKGRVRDTGAWAVPTADTAMTTNAISSWYQKGVVCRRVKLYGNEDFASLAGSESTDDWKADLGRIMAHNIGINMEKLFFTYLIPAAFDATSGALYSTHCVDNSTESFQEYMFAQGKQKLGENSQLLNTVIMHSNVFWQRRINVMLTETPVYSTALATREALSTTFVGRIGNLNVYLNDRVGTSGSGASTIYDTILGGPGALYWGVQLANSVEIFPRSTKAGGTDEIGYKLAGSPAIAKVTWGGTLTNELAGALDSEVGTATNWTLSTGAAVADTPLVVIKSLA